MSSSSADRRELDALLADDIDAELDLWRRLAFHTDMPPRQDRRDDRPAQGNPANDPANTQFPIPPPQVPPETYNYLMQALLSLQGSPPPPYPYPIHANPAPNYNYPWPPHLPPTSLPGPSFYPPNPEIPHLLPPQTAGPSQFPPSPTASTSTASATQDQDGSEDAMSITEDKRRRNTAASARFRAKKKTKTLNLERTVADLTGRTEELEREATDLRRENSWLKEIVVLKGRNLAAASQGAGPSDQRTQDDKEGSQDESEAESTVKRGEKGKEKERG